MVENPLGLLELTSEAGFLHFEFLSLAFGELSTKSSYCFEFFEKRSACHSCPNLVHLSFGFLQIPIVHLSL